MGHTCLKALAAMGVLVGSAASLAADEPPQPLDQPGYAGPARAWESVEDMTRELPCRDRIEHARAAAGQPPSDSSPTTPDQPLLIHAVDHRVDGCGVLVPVGDRANIRQSPPPGQPRLQPAR